MSSSTGCSTSIEIPAECERTLGGVFTLSEVFRLREGFNSKVSNAVAVKSKLVSFLRNTAFVGKL